MSRHANREITHHGPVPEQTYQFLLWLIPTVEKFPRSRKFLLGDRIIQSWDTASKAEELHDYSVCTTWLEQGNSYYLVDVFRERLEYPDLKRRVVDEARRHDADVVVIEDKGSGTHLNQELDDEGSLKPIPIMPEGDKVTRMAAQSAKIEAGYVYLPERAHWLQDFQTEILQFPHGRHDDQVDSMSQFLRWVSDSGPVEAVFAVW